LVPTLDPPSFEDDGTVNPVTVGDSDGVSATPSPLRRLDVCLAVPKDEGGVTMLAPLPVSDGDEDSTLNPCCEDRVCVTGDADRTSMCADGGETEPCLAPPGTPRLELTGLWISASCAGDVPNIIYVSCTVPLSSMRSGNAAVCAAGREGN
jgi:hypothetical protein